MCGSSNSLDSTNYPIHNRIMPEIDAPLVKSNKRANKCMSKCAHRFVTQSPGQVITNTTTDKVAWRWKSVIVAPRQKLKSIRGIRKNDIPPQVTLAMIFRFGPATLD